MNKTFRHKALEAFFEKGSKAGIQPSDAPRLKRQLERLEKAQDAADMNVPGWGLHPIGANIAIQYGP
jgi:proteic killer suppression protein